MSFPKKLLESSRLPANYKRLSKILFMERAYSIFFGKSAPKMSLNRTHWDTNFDSARPDRHSRGQKKAVKRYTSTEAFLMGHVEKTENMKYGCSVLLLNAWVEQITAEVRRIDMYV